MSVKKDNGKSPTVPVSVLAKLFNLTSVRVQQLAADGIISKAGRGQYDLWSSVRGYIKFLQERKVNQWDSDDNLSDIKKEQLRRTKEEADKLELINAKTRGELVEVELVKREGEKASGKFAQGKLSPQSCFPSLPSPSRFLFLRLPLFPSVTH